METRKLIARKLFALLAFVAIAAAVFVLAPPQTRLVVSLFALPLETLIVASLFSESGQPVQRSYSSGRHSLAD
jgi:hypothetical protein